jgi:hypothetical protein
MAHYAFLDNNNIVTEVIVGIDETELIEGLDTETWYANFRAGVQLRDQVDTWFPDRRTVQKDGWAIAVTPPENRIIIQTNTGGSEQLILMLGWSHPTASHLIWLTRSESQPNKINAYHTSSITGEYAQRY